MTDETLGDPGRKWACEMNANNLWPEHGKYAFKKKTK